MPPAYAALPSGQSSLERLDRLRLVAGMARPRADMGDADLIQQIADRGLVVEGAEARLE